MNNIAYFEIQSSNPARDAQFYQAVFGGNLNSMKAYLLNITA